MLHDSHQLNDVVAKSLDAGQDIGSKLLVSSDPRLRGRYTNMGLVYSGILGRRRAGIFEGVFLI